MSIKRCSEAEQQYKKVLEFKPDFIRAIHNYAILLNKMNRDADAEIYYQKL